MVSLRWARGLKPASWLGSTHFPENSTLGPALRRRARIPLGQAPRPSQAGHDDYQSAEADRAAILAFRASKSLQAADSEERMASHHYHFLTRWRMEATPEEVYAIIADTPSYVRWWPAVWL